MNLDAFHACLAQSNARGYELDDRQREAVDHGTGPLWLLAGPGSGKTEVLVTRTLKLVCVDKVDPRSILLTTFTKKAARNLEDRLASYLTILQAEDSSLQSVDLADLRIGTLHSLCNDIMHEYRYPDYQNVRLLDDVEQHLFVYRYAEIVQCEDPTFWGPFEYALSRWSANSSFLPNRWQRTRAAVNLFNHIVEDFVDLNSLRAAGGHWQTLADFYEQYTQVLREHYRCDFAHLQSRFLDFISRDTGRRFLEGDGDTHLPLVHVLVDEYQDTNPIQERIYLALAAQKPHNLTVVGDDDQALYRFRGGTVACMVNFDRACQTAYRQTPKSIQLDRNYRSHAGIVSFFNDYISSFPELQEPGVRAPNKRPVEARSAIQGNYPAVNWLAKKKAGDLPQIIANFIQDHLVGDGVIEDLSQCVILMRSTRDSPRNAGPILAELRSRGIPVYNPRAKSFMESEEVQCLLAALIHVIDPNFTFLANRTRDLPATVQGWVNMLVALDDAPQVDLADLTDYIQRSEDNLRREYEQSPGTFLNLSLMEILYRILSLEPFRTWRRDPERNMRLSKVTRLFESYHSLNLDKLRVNDQGTDLDQGFRDRFYYTFISYLLEAGIDDDEDEEVIVPRGYIPIMTIHQSKGLEFPFVIVAQVTGRNAPGAAQFLERDLAPFRQDLYPRNSRTPEDLAQEDNVRLYYVAYSRPQHGLMIAATQSQLRNNTAIPGRDATQFRRSMNRPII